jgi:acetylglutamate kinase
LSSRHHASSNPEKGPIVVKIGGAFLDEPERHRATLDGIVELHRAGLARGSGVVLVHGGGILVDRHLARLDIVTERVDGIRVTPPEAVEEIVGVLAGRVNTRLVGLFAPSVRAVGLSLGDGALCACRKATRYAFDPGAVGEVTGGDPTLVHTLLRGGFLPIISSIGLAEDGGFLNINADDAAAAIASIVGASELVLLTDVAGVLDAQGAVIAELDRARIESLIADGTISGGMTPKVRGALDAAERSGVPVTIASWRNPASVLPKDGLSASCTRVLPTGTPSGHTELASLRV